MIHKVLTNYAERLNEYLTRNYKRLEGLAAAGQIGGQNESLPNKIIISLLNVERETSGGISPRVSMGNGGNYSKMQPSLLLNLNVIMAAFFDEKRYDDSLSVLSDTICFVQTYPKFVIDGVAYTIEVVNCSMQDYNNVWTLLGGHCYPSVICKIRNLVVDGSEISSNGLAVDSPDIETNSLS